jgi:hypothetical protein
MGFSLRIALSVFNRVLEFPAIVQSMPPPTGYPAVDQGPGKSIPENIPARRTSETALMGILTNFLLMDSDPGTLLNSLFPGAKNKPARRI